MSGLELRQSVDLGMKQSTRIELNSDELRMLDLAYRLWEEKPHDVFSVQLSDLLRLVGHELTGPDREIQREFITLSSGEIERLMPGERVGALIGECIFVSGDIPHEYIPMVMVNLTVGAAARENEELTSALSERCGEISTDMAGHWSANLIDVIAAEHQFADDTKQMTEFLAWRKRVEQTSFFQNPAINDLLNQRLKSLRFRRTTHPSERHPRAALSWALAGEVVAYSRMEAAYKELGGTRVDLLYRRIVGERNYDPAQMLRLLSSINAVLEQAGTRILNVADDSELDKQAYLLTPDVSGDAAVLKPRRDNDGHYTPVKMAKPTIDALRDRIAFFNRRAVERQLPKSGVSRSLLDLIAHASTATIAGLGGRVIEISLENEAAKERGIAAMREQVGVIDGELEKVADLLRRHIELEEKLAQLAGSSVSIMPGDIEGKKRELETHQHSLITKKEELTRALKVLEEIANLRTEQGLLLSKTVLTEEDPPIRKALGA